MPRRSEMMRSARSGSEQSRQSNDQFVGHTGLLFGTLALHHRQARERVDARQINAVGGEGVLVLQAHARQFHQISPMLPVRVYCIPPGSSRIPAVMAGLVPAIPIVVLRHCQLDRDRRGIGDDIEARAAVTDYVYEIACSGGPEQEAAVQAWADRDAAPIWTALPGLSAVDLYQPVRGGTHDPFNSDGPGPLLMAMLQFPTRQALAGALAQPRFQRSLSDMPAGPTFTGTSFGRRFYPTAGAPNPGPLSAPFSYVVRYHHPAEDVAAFVSHYLADHPPILGKLPEIRSVLCYLPFDADVPGLLPPADYMLGNEVVFDSPEAFNAAMASPVRLELRAHYKSFPKFTGRNTHFPMMRRQLLPH
jgi:uncharacterized protein (TIGR02118 family)